MFGRVVASVASTEERVAEGVGGEALAVEFEAAGLFTGAHGGGGGGAWCWMGEFGCQSLGHGLGGRGHVLYFCWDFGGIFLVGDAVFWFFLLL